MKKDLLNIYDLEKAVFDEIFYKAGRWKKMFKYGESHTPLTGKTLGMLFEKSSTRTRLSFEVGMYHLGGMAIFLSVHDIQLGRGETTADTASIMSRYLNGIMIRTFSQELVNEFAGYATIPVINGLTDLLHPCQILSDLFTLVEKRGKYEGLKVAYVGDGNNIANSWINAAAKLPFQLALACPAGYDPDETILERGVKEGEVTLYRDPSEAAKDADVVYTDVWASMGQEDEHEKRVEVFKNYQVNKELIGYAKDNVIIMHCLPAHRGEEITADVIDGPCSVVVDQAENRLHVQKAIMEMLMA